MDDRLPTSYYQQFNADLARDVPAEAFGGWKSADLPLSLTHTALVVMHAWNVGGPADRPDWFRSIEYLQRAYAIADAAFPPLLAAARGAGIRVIHVVGGGGDYYSHLPGFRGDASGPRPTPSASDPTYEKLREFRRHRVHPGADNLGVLHGDGPDFSPSAFPVGDEGIAATTQQLVELCEEAEINHLVYVGFALNLCLLSSDGGMADMTRRGYLCSTVRGATTAVENRETARAQLHLESAYWRVSVVHGFVYDLSDFTAFLERHSDAPSTS